MTFNGLYLKICTPEVTLHWDGLGSLIVGVPPAAPSLGLCGTNKRGEDQVLKLRRGTGTAN